MFGQCLLINDFLTGKIHADLVFWFKSELVSLNSGFRFSVGLISPGLTPESTTHRIPAALTHAKRCSVGEQVEPLRYLLNMNPFATLLAEVLTYDVG